MPGKERTRLNSKRTNPLGEDLEAERYASLKSTIAGDAEVDDDDNDNDVQGRGRGKAPLIPNHTTRRILRTARRQLEDVRDDLGTATAYGDEIENEEDEGGIDPALQAALDGGGGGPTAEGDKDDDDYEYMGNEDDDDEARAIAELEYDDNDSVASSADLGSFAGTDGVTGAEYYAMDDEEARLLNKFQPASRVQSRTLADMIMEKIREKEMEGRQGAAEGEDEGEGGGRKKHGGVDPRVARVYSAIGTVMKKYTSGKVPKALKILPNIENWEELVMLTRPHEWSPHATYQATRIFASSLNERMAQRFYATVFLPIVHQHMLEQHKLHPSLYMAIRKALFKPVAFFKGFLLPLALDEECTLREALVVASVLQRSHLPPIPTAVCIVKIAQQPFSGPCSVFLRVLIDKKMALPFQAIDALVAYFHRFVTSHPRDEPLPVLWHQTLLSFTQRYKSDLTPEQLELLSQVCQVHFHYMITPEIRKEITAAQRAARAAA